MTQLHEKFAKFSGARVLPKQETESTLAVDLPEFVEPEETTQPAEQEEPSYVQERFKKNKAIWKNPKVTLGVVGVISLLAAFSVAAIFNNNFQMPDFSKAKLGSEEVADDDTVPQQPQDGQFQSAAIGMGLGEGFEREGERENPFLDEKPPETNAQSQAGKGTSTTVKPVSAPTPTYRTMSTPPPTTYIPPTPRRYAPPPAPVYRSVPRPAASPQVSAPAPAAPKPEVSPQDRVAAILAATSASGISQGIASNQPNQVGNQPVANAGQPGQVEYLASEQAILDGQPQTLISRSQTAEAELLTGIAFASGELDYLRGQPIEVSLTEPLGEIPMNARIIAIIDPGTNGRASGTNSASVIRLVPTAIAHGDMEIPLDECAPMSAVGGGINPCPVQITSQDGAPLVAKRGGSEVLRFLGGLLNNITGAVSLGNIAGGQGGFGGNLTSLGANLGSGIITNGAQRLVQSGDNGANILYVKPGKKLLVSVNRPLSLPQYTFNTSDISQVVQFQPGPLIAMAQDPIEPTQPTQAYEFRPPTDEELMSMVQEGIDVD